MCSFARSLEHGNRGVATRFCVAAPHRQAAGQEKQRSAAADNTLSSKQLMAIKLFDSLTRELRELQPSQPDGVFRFYNCGPTVYAPAHIGNFRTFVINDVIRRLLVLELGAEKVHYVRNLTDVDD